MAAASPDTNSLDLSPLPLPGGSPSDDASSVVSVDPDDDDDDDEDPSSPIVSEDEDGRPIRSRSRSSSSASSTSSRQRRRSTRVLSFANDLDGIGSSHQNEDEDDNGSVNSDKLSDEEAQHAVAIEKRKAALKAALNEEMKQAATAEVAEVAEVKMAEVAKAAASSASSSVEVVRSASPAAASGGDSSGSNVVVTAAAAGAAAAGSVNSSPQAMDEGLHWVEDAGDDQDKEEGVERQGEVEQQEQQQKEDRERKENRAGSEEGASTYYQGPSNDDGGDGGGDDGGDGDYDRELMTKDRSFIFEERLKDAAALQDLGNRLFAVDEDYLGSIRSYQRGLWHVDFGNFGMLELMPEHQAMVSEARFMLCSLTWQAQLCADLFDDALDSACMALEIRPRNGMALFRKARVLRSLGRADESATALDGAEATIRA
eukprot:g4301.t1